MEKHTHSAAAESPGRFRAMLEKGSITPHFQPIFDLYTGDIFGYEILSRGEHPFENPATMFERAREYGLAWELEYACRIQALKSIADLPASFKTKYFFLNVSPHIFNNPEFLKGFTPSDLKVLGIDLNKIVIEITETSSIEDYRGFERLIRYYVEQGFHVALDDFGAGHSGLITLVAMTPHFLKLDRAVISDIHLNSYKQNLVKAIASFAGSVETHMIAEGI
ncbi:MAG: EAL domain-containing protein, partial [Spirochaetota bacterium]